MSEPIHDRGEMNEAQEGAGEFIVSSADSTLGFDAAKEVLDLMALPVVTAVETGRPQPTAFGRDAAAGVLGAQARPEDIGIEALVGHDPAMAHADQHWDHGVLVVLLARSQTESHRPPPRIDDRRELGVQAAFGPAHRLRRLSAGRIGSVLVQLDVGAVQVPQFALGPGRQQTEHPGKQPSVTPAAIAGIDRTPRSVTLRQITPRHSRPQDVEHRAEHYPVVFRRATSPRHCAITPSPRFSRRIRSIFLAAPIAARGSTGDQYNTCAHSDSVSSERFHHFENTP